MQAPLSLERLEQLKRAEPAIYFHIEELAQRGTYSRKDYAFIRSLMDLGIEQMQSASAWYEYELMRSRHEVAYLEGVIQHWDQTPLSERPSVCRETSSERLRDLLEEMKQIEVITTSARKKGAFWSIVPLLEFFDLPEEERAGKSCFPLLPHFMQKAYLEILLANRIKAGLMARWIANIRRLKIGGSVTGGGVEIDHNDPEDTERK